MQTAKKLSHPTYQPSVIDLQKKTFSDPQLTSSQKVVLCSLRLYIGYDSRKRASIRRIAEMVGLAESRTREILSSLVDMGRLSRVIKLGHCNEWSIPDHTPTEARPLLRPSKYKENVTDPEPQENVISIFSLEEKQPDTPSNSPHVNNSPESPKTSHFDAKNTTPQDDKTADSPRPKKPIPMHIVRALVEVTNDRKSFGLWCLVARDIPLDEIRYAVESLRIAQHDNIVRSPGRYLTSILKARCPEAFSKTSPVSPSTSMGSIVTHLNSPTEQIPAAKKHPSEPVIEPQQDYETGLAAIANIRAMLSGKPQPAVMEAS